VSAFVKPPWRDDPAWNDQLKRRTIDVGDQAIVGLTLVPGGPTLSVTSSNPSIARLDELNLRAGLRLFRVSAIGVDAGSVEHAMLEARDFAGTVRAAMQLEVRGPAPRKAIAVSLSKQILEGFEGSTKQFEFDCVTGAPDAPTIPGIFCISHKDRLHRSAASNAPMNFALFFSPDGRAIHQYHGVTPLSILRRLKASAPEWFGSRGCVRLSEGNAHALFDWASIGTTVKIR
jgi:L,D-transpeptidase-like protein